MRRNIAPLNWVQWVTLLLLLAYATTTPLLFLQVRRVEAHQNVSIVQLHRQAEEAVTTHHALCALRQSIRQQELAGAKFLRQNPHGIPGISAPQIRQSISRQQATVHALRGLRCH